MLNANGSNFGAMFIILEPFDERRGPALTRRGHRGRAPRARFEQEIPEARVLRLRRPAGATAWATPAASS